MGSLEAAVEVKQKRLESNETYFNFRRWESDEAGKTRDRMRNGTKSIKWVPGETPTMPVKIWGNCQHIGVKGMPQESAPTRVKERESAGARKVTGEEEKRERAHLLEEGLLLRRQL